MGVRKPLTWLAATLASVVAATHAVAFTAALYAGIESVSAPADQSRSAGAAIFWIPFVVAGFGFPIALVHAVLLGLPIAIVMQKKGWTGWAVSTMTGFLIGVGPIFIAPLLRELLSMSFAGGMAAISGDEWLLAAGAHFGCAGIVGALTFRATLAWCGVPIDPADNIPPPEAAKHRRRAISVICLVVGETVVLWGLLLSS